MVLLEINIKYNINRIHIKEIQHNYVTINLMKEVEIMNDNKKYKKMLMTIAILGIAVVVLSFYIVYDRFIDNKQEKVTQNDTTKKVQQESKKDNTVNAKYENMSDGEIKEFLDSTNTTYYLNRQDKSISDVKKFLEDQNYTILENTLLTVYDYENPQEYISEDEIIKKTLELYGYNVIYNFIDVGEHDEVAFKWDASIRKYKVIEPSIYGHGSMHINVDWQITNIKKCDDNSYDVTARQLWTNEMGDGDPAERFYFSYADSNNNNNPVFSIEAEESYSLDNDKLFEKAFAEANKIKDGGYYTYHIIKEKGRIKITQYTIN